MQRPSFHNDNLLLKSSDSSEPASQQERAQKESPGFTNVGVGAMFSDFLWRNIKYISLIILVVQNAALVLTMRYSRKVHEEKLYLASTAVVLTELMKFVISGSVLFYISNFDVEKTGRTLYLEIIVKASETLKLSVPSVLYTIQNNLLYVALSHLDAVTFQVTYQLKILTTALFSVFILKRSLSGIKWVSLVVLMCAVALVQWPSSDNSQPSSDSSLPPSETSQVADSEDNLHSSLIGLSAILLACVSSGFNGVYIEKILKSSDTSMWIRNIQLSLLSFFVGLFGVFVYDWSAIMADGFFQGYSFIVLAVITLQALGGIIVAVVMKYADNILKGFAASLSIILSSIVSFFLLHDMNPSWNFLLGTVLVFVATVMYSQSPPKVILPVTDSKHITGSKGS